MTAAPNRDAIQGMWIGPRLSAMEQLCIASFLQNGHEFHLYVYDEVAGIPAGAVVRDANEVLPAWMIFQYYETRSYAGFANFFRYKLLLERGGWWVDMDMICLRPFDFTSDHVVSSELHEGVQTPNSSAIRAPAGSVLMAYCWEFCERQDVTTLRWGQTGAILIGEAVRELGLQQAVQPVETFCPIGYLDWELILQDREWQLEASHAVHLYNEMWRRAERDKDTHYDPACLYEGLRRRYLRSSPLP